MHREEILTLLKMVGEEMEKREATAEIVIAGGTAMILLLGNREGTKDVDAYFRGNVSVLREAAGAVAARMGLPQDWLNDAVKDFFATTPPENLWGQFPGLRIYTVAPESLFAMKAAAARPEDLADLADLADLVRFLKIKDAATALGLVEKYIPARLLVPKIRYVVEGLFGHGSEQA